ncbi:MAG: hypothetical protein U5Q03_13450 [Bacteroidota bacterium]|nr:hypothetical protein [Bacteroidota bacterium]
MNNSKTVIVPANKKEIPLGTLNSISRSTDHTDLQKHK